ncbi:DUF6221 family protein [Streptomyces sp. NBC_01022]|uniref:DUF6221 family protein n=1 Tax=Streptomyces sp. NBC_01022 TaxID=2903723 RepID=UPI002DDBF6A4|nr:DUF6221 family protein [Streptomyces sp. NBC_01022]WRZ79448.1 DUF6221 family protein [Streptomyces sp. NBC_01022]WRZ86228.1 DUF6221 family protein [Streptomyces sp. NBC_01022]
MVRDDLPVKVEFLVARLREDETAALALKPGKNADIAGLQARVLADVEAKRQLLGWTTDPPRLPEVGDLSGWQAHAWEVVVGTVDARRLSKRRPVVDVLVAAYVDHPDFHPEWKLIEDNESREEERGTRARIHTA